MHGHAESVSQPDVHFERSEPLTLGIEEEFVLVEADDGITPANRAHELLDHAPQTIASPGGWMKPELLRSSIELTTAPNARMVQQQVDLVALRDALVHRADAAGMHVMGIGMHPTLRARRSHVTDTTAHQVIADLHERVGTLADQVTHGIHVHVGMPSLADAVRVMNALAGCVPMFIALTVNSPIHAGVRAPWRSTRSEVLRRMLWAGPTPHIEDLDDYVAVHRLHQMENTGDQRFLWDVAPVTTLGTVEVRAFDASPHPTTALAMAAFVQAIAALVLDGRPLPRANESLERHNRWSAMEFGARARFLAPDRTEPTDVGDLVRELVELVRPYARDLGNEPWLDPIEGMLDAPHVDDVIAAFEAGGAAGVLATCRVRAGATDRVDT